MTIKCNLYSEWIAAVRQELAKAGLSHTGLTDQDCAIIWQSWKRRTVPPATRTIKKATGFACPTHLQQGLSVLDTAFSSAAPIWPWQSKLIDKPTREDGLYNDYRVVHFHLGAGTEKNGYINRTNELLFALVDSSTVYEIGIYCHGDWYELDILDVIDSNWPTLLDRVTIHGVDIAHCPSTRDEVKALRDAKVVSIVKLKSGRIIAPPGGGIATDGTSIDAVRSADYFAMVLRNGEKAIEPYIRDQVQKGMMPDKDYTIHLQATDDEIAGVCDGAYKWILWKRVQ